MKALLDAMFELVKLAVTEGMTVYHNGDAADPYIVRCTAHNRVTAEGTNGFFVLAMPIEEFMVRFSTEPLYNSAEAVVPVTVGEITADAHSLLYMTTTTQQAIAAAICAAVEADREGRLEGC